MDRRKKESQLLARNLAKRQRYAIIKSDPELYEAERQKEKQRYIKKKEKGLVKSIDEKTDREKRMQRKKWREAAKKYREKKKESMKLIDIPKSVMITNDIDEEQPGTSQSLAKTINCSPFVHEPDPLKTPISQEAKIRRIRYLEFKKRKRLLTIIKELREENKMLKLEIKKLKKRNIKTALNEKVVKAKENKAKTDQVTGKKNQLREIKLAQLVRDFYCQDSSSTVVAGKKQYITKNKKQMQKRHLTASLKTLYQKFTSQHNIRISYAFFCRNRPFWVLYPKKNERETCACIVHSNIDLTAQCLQKADILVEKNAQEILISLCYSQYSERCLKRDCNDCKTKTLEYQEFTNDFNLKHEQWVRCKETVTTKKGLKTITITTKKEFARKPLEVIHELELQLIRFFKHCYKIHIQYVNINNLKENLQVNEALIHVDFSENFSLKFGKEVQGHHWSRKEVCLHTAVIYTFNFEYSAIDKICACTLSESLRHDASAVWAHLMPLIQLAIEKNPFIDILHVKSDSPTSQYRNKFIFHMLPHICDDFPQIKRVTWNYTVTGHGKGAPDGVGATIKRTADSLVTFGQDIGTFNQLVQCLQINTENIEIMIVHENNICEKEARFPKNIKPFKGTLEVHQVLWDTNSNKLTFRDASCFECSPEVICWHYNHLGFLPVSPFNYNLREEPEIDVVPLASTRKRR